MMDTKELSRLLQQMHRERDAELKARFDRVLPFADGLFDRWDRAKFLGFGNNVSIYDSALIFGEVTVGDNTWIGPYVLLDGSGGGISIGQWCSISTGVQIYTHDSVLRALSGGVLPQRTGSVRCGDCCYIGSQSIVAVGATIGNHCVIAANSFVNRDVLDRTIVGGNPAKRLGRVEGTGKDVRLVYDSVHNAQQETDR